MTPNGTLPTFLLFPDSSSQWHLRDSYGNLLFDGLYLRYETLLNLVIETGASYQIINTTRHYRIEERQTTDGTPPN